LGEGEALMAPVGVVAPEEQWELVEREGDAGAEGQAESEARRWVRISVAPVAKAMALPGRK
jgi:hypothetical protein